MKTINITDKCLVNELLQQGEQEEVVLLRDGRAVAMIVPFDEDDVQWYARERDPDFIKSIARARQQVRAGNTVNHETLKRESGLE